MPPRLIYGGPASVDINIAEVNIGPCMIDPPGAVPSMIDHVVVTPVEIHAQPAADRQAKSKGDERRIARGRTFNVYDRRVILGDIYILRLGRNDLDIVSFDNDALFTVTDQVADGPRPPPEPLDRTGHVFRLVKKGISQVGSPIHILGHHLKNVWIVGNCPDGLGPILLINT
jgi:hypothetical protein